MTKNFFFRWLTTFSLFLLFSFLCPLVEGKLSDSRFHNDQEMELPKKYIHKGKEVDIENITIKTISGQPVSTLEPRSAHFALSSPPSYYPGMFALMNSVLINTQSKSQIRFWIFSDEREVKRLSSLLQTFCGFLSDQDLVIVSFRSSELPLVPLLTEIVSPKQPKEGGILRRTSRLSKFIRGNERKSKLSLDVHNYIRYYIPAILSPQRLEPSLRPEVIIYLDVDTIVLGDIAHLFNELKENMGLGKGHLGRGVCAAFARRDRPVLSTILQGTGGSETNRLLALLGEQENGTTFNAGVMGIHLDCWNQLQITQQLYFWIVLRQARAIYALGSQPPLLLTFRSGGEEYYPFDLTWNTDALHSKWPAQGVPSLLHWNGKYKPWTKEASIREFKQLWHRYSIVDIQIADFSPSPKSFHRRLLVILTEFTVFFFVYITWTVSSLCSSSKPSPKAHCV